MKYKILLIIALIATSISNNAKLDKHILPIYGNATLGYYYVNLFIGSPSQQQSVIIDTGSGQLAVPCSECVSCGKSHIHKPFDLRKSSTNKIITCNTGYEVCRSTCGTKDSTSPCTFGVSYAQGSSLSGIILEDRLQLENQDQNEGIVTTFGCTTKQTNLFFTQAANGIFGLAPERKARFLDLLYEKHRDSTGEQFLFSLCLSKNGGQMSVGKVNQKRIVNSTSVKTKFTPSRNLYTLQNVGSVKIGQKILRKDEDLGYYGMFIDSGSTFTYMRYKQHNLFLRQIQNNCASQGQSCKIAKQGGLNCIKIKTASDDTLEKAVMRMFPSLDIQINGQKVSWFPNRYFFIRNRVKGELCLGVDALDRFLLGGNWMVDRNIVFNLVEETVEIFSNAECNGALKDDLPIYYDSSIGNLNYISAVLNIDQGVLARILIFVVIFILLMIILVFIGIYCLKKTPKQQIKKEKENKQLTEQQHVEIEENASQISNRSIVFKEVQIQELQSSNINHNNLQ